MKQYKEALQFILDNGKVKSDRTNVGTISVFGYQMRFDLRQGFPATTTKKLAWKAVVSELLWFLEGSSDERRLAEILHGTRDPSKKTIWTANANADYWKPKAQFPGDVSRIYGVQWRQWRTGRKKWTSSSDSQPEVVDQIQQLIDGIKKDPSGRRHILTAWNPGELDQMALPPCHVMSQFDVTDGYLSCQLYQRSCDFGLGIPFNIASYSLLTHMLAQICNLEVGDFIWSGGDCHIYNNHVKQIEEQLGREPFQAPKLIMPKFKNLEELLNTKPSDYILEGYNHHPAINMPMAV